MNNPRLLIISPSNFVCVMYRRLSPKVLLGPKVLCYVKRYGCSCPINLIAKHFISKQFFVYQNQILFMDLILMKPNKKFNSLTTKGHCSNKKKKYVLAHLLSTVVDRFAL